MPRTQRSKQAPTTQSPPGSQRPGGSGAPLRILQITDLHLYADPQGRLLGQNTRLTLDLVLELASRTYWPVDRILITGDLVHDESTDGYRYLEQRLARLETPCNVLPGNHDTNPTMARTLDGTAVSSVPALRCGPWNLIFLDSTVPGDEGGHLNPDQLGILEKSLAAEPDAHTLVCMHHQPIPVGSVWMDTMALDNADDFFAVIDRHPQVRGILWGHIHQDFAAERNGVALLGSPSTCIQFLPRSTDFAVDALTPGFRWLDLYPDGRIDTGIFRIDDYPVPMDLTTGGY